MANNPLTVKGTNKLIKQMLDEVMDAAKRAKNQDQPNYRISGKINVDGQFGFDKEGNLGIVGRVVAEGPSGAVEVGAEVEGQVGLAFKSMGDGHIRISVEVEVFGDPMVEVEE